MPCPGRASGRERGEVKLGTIESWLIWKLTGGNSHVTDATNASRTSLMDLKTRQWRPDLAELFDVPLSALPEIRGCADHLGDCDPSLFGHCPAHSRRGGRSAGGAGRRMGR